MVSFLVLAGILFHTSCGSEVSPDLSTEEPLRPDPTYLLLWDSAIEVKRGTHFITTNFLLIGDSAKIAAIQDSELQALRSVAIDLIGDNTIRLLAAFDDREFRQREIVERLNEVLSTDPFSDVYLLDFSFGEALWGPDGEKTQGDDA